MQTAFTRLWVLEMVAPLVLHAKSIDIDKAFSFFRIIDLIPEYSQSNAPQRKTKTKSSLVNHK